MFVCTSLVTVALAHAVTVSPVVPGMTYQEVVAALGEKPVDSHLFGGLPNLNTYWTFPRAGVVVVTGGPEGKVLSVRPIEKADAEHDPLVTVSPVAPSMTLREIATALGEDPGIPHLFGGLPNLNAAWTFPRAGLVVVTGGPEGKVLSVRPIEKADAEHGPLG